jgi:hypothetical protein
MTASGWRRAPSSRIRMGDGTLELAAAMTTKILRTIAAAAFVVASTLASAQAFAPGEETVLDVKFLSMTTGEARISVGQPAGDVWPVIFQARTQGLAGFIDIREHLVSYWDSTARQSRGYDLRAYEVGDYHQDSARFDRVNGKAIYEKQRKGNKQVRTIDIPADVHDLTAAVMWLRLQPLAPGQHYELPILSGTRQFKLVADVLAREEVDTPAGRFTALKVQARTAFEGKFQTKRDTFVWFSDDPRHIIVRTTADFAVGSIVASLKSYRPGTRLAASP